VGRRRAKTIGGTTTQFLYDGLNPVQELASGTPTANLLTGLGIDEYFTRTDAAGVRNFLTDALESSVGLADGSGVVQTEYTYEPFGVSNTVGSATTTSIGFTGREADGTGLYFYRARYYSPGLQRFVSEDPVQFAGGTTNLHEYVASDPVNGIDPTGLQIPVPIPLPTPGPIPTFPWIPGHEPKDLLPPIDPSPVPRTIPDPKKPGRCRCACICRADADDTMPGNIKPEWPRFAFGSAIAANCSTARKEAEKKAKHILGMKAKHVQCKCAG
jgi:RHS repeat-associated protein